MNDPIAPKRTAEHEEASGSSTQPHYTCAQLAKLWGFHQSTILRIFKNESGVLRLGNIRAKKRVKISLRIPQEVADRVYARLTGRNAA